MKRLIILAAALALIACQSPGSSPGSPSAGAPTTAAGGFGAGTVAGDQGQAQTPQTTTAGPATQNWWFASQVDSAVQAAILAIAERQNWTAEQVTAALQATNGAPQNVTLNTGAISITTGSPEATGASGGTGGGGTAGGVTRP